MLSRLALLVLGASCLAAAFATRAATGGATDTLSLMAVLVPALAGGVLLLAAWAGRPALRGALLAVTLSGAVAL